MSAGTHGSFVWYDLLTPDPDAAVAFYQHVVGWTSRPFGGGDAPYTMFVGGEGPICGTTRPEGEGVRPQWLSNVCVDDVDATAAEVVALGGRLLSPPADYPTVGRLAVVTDPEGAALNIFKPKQPIQLHDATKPGELTWNELMTTNHEVAFAYYSRLFGWQRLREVDLGPMGKYLVYGQGERELGGMFTRVPSASMPATWTYYIQVADLDAAVARAQSKAGRLISGPLEVPGGARVAQLVDPQGAVFALHESAKPKRA